MIFSYLTMLNAFFISSVTNVQKPLLPRGLTVLRLETAFTQNGDF